MPEASMPLPRDPRGAPSRGGPARHRPSLRLAHDGAATPDDEPQQPQAPALTPDDAPRARLAPRAEPPAGRLTSSGPLPGPAPVLGSPEARARRVAGDDAASAHRPGGVTGAPDGPLPDPTPLCCAMVQAAVEGLRGARPLAQLVRWVSPEVYEQLFLRAELVSHAGTPSPAGRAGIRRIRVFRIGDSTAEATVVVDDGPRVRAVAVRLEGHRGRWRATAMEIG